MRKQSVRNAAPDSLETVYRLHADGLAAITRKVRDDEADLAQEACLRLVETARREPVAAPVNLLFRIARNLVIDRMRGRARAALLFREPGDRDDQHPSPSPDPERILLANERLGLALEVIERMPDRRREAFLLHRIDGLSYRRIAQRMGISVKGVEKHISAAMLDLTRGMRVRGFED